MCVCKKRNQKRRELDSFCLVMVLWALGRRRRLLVLSESGNCF